MYKIAVITGSRAEYGLLRPVLEKMKAHPALDFHLLVTGAHLHAAFGHTVDEIEADGHKITARLDILSSPAPEGRAGTAVRTNLALHLFLQHFSQPENRPDAVLLLGDRYEAFAAAQAAALLDIPVVHISGGDVTLGADDDWFRHCITKMAKLHFPSCEAYRQRLLRMGEQPDRVFNVGGLGDENIRHMRLMSREELGQSLGLDLTGPFALVTYHPETRSFLPPGRQAAILLEAVEAVPKLFYLFTKANADAGGQEINLALQQFCTGRPNAVLMDSLGAHRYLSAMKEAALVLGNSSSGVVEAPSLKTPAVNIGQRQEGRLKSENVIDCPLDAGAIAAAIYSAASPQFAARAKQAKSPYDGGDTSGRIAAELERALADGILRQPKGFFDGF